MEKELRQQGDVLFFAVDSIPKGLKKKKAIIPGLATFAEGETTSHHHSAIVEKTDAGADNIILYEDEKGVLWCKVNEETTVTHQEHKPVTLSPGNYRVGIVREYDPFEKEIRSVRD